VQIVNQLALATAKMGKTQVPETYFMQDARYTKRGNKMEERVLTAILEASYGLSDYQLRSLNSRGLLDGTCVYEMYHVQRSSLPSLVFFAYHDRLAEKSTFRWERDQSVQDWLAERVHLLSYLEQQDYPAPRVFPSQNGSATVRHEHWNILITTFIEGRAQLQSPDHLYLLAAAVGRLHGLALPTSVGLSWWNTSYSLPHALGQLEACAPFIPASHQVFYDQCKRTFVTIQQALHQLRECIIHGDVWAPNGVRTSEQEVVLIDWEGAGRGAALLDLGELLLKGQYSKQGTIPETINEDSIAALVSGYSRWRCPEPLECELLLEAIRFRCAWVGAWLLSSVLLEGWTAKVEEALNHVQRGYRLAEPTAALALQCFARG
jgi:Ser/Thr protein kinase RdoA (MazF antagonist)